MGDVLARPIATRVPLPVARAFERVSSDGEATIAGTIEPRVVRAESGPGVALEASPTIDPGGEPLPPRDPETVAEDAFR